MKSLIARARFVASESGATATEYALLISGVSVVLVALIVIFGESLAVGWDGFAKVL